MTESIDQRQMPRTKTEVFARTVSIGQIVMLPCTVGISLVLSGTVAIRLSLVWRLTLGNVLLVLGFLSILNALACLSGAALCSVGGSSNSAPLLNRLTWRCFLLAAITFVVFCFTPIGAVSTY